MTDLAADPRLVGLIATMLLVYCRIQACLLSLPGFSMSVLPVRVKVAIAVSMTPLLAEAVPVSAVPMALGPFALGCAAELVTGLVLGGMVRLFAVALDVAAAAIAATASLSQLVGASTEYSPHPVGNFFHLAGLAVLMALGFPFAVCELVRDSLVLRPIAAWPQIQNLFPAVIGLLWQGFLLALMLASPFILGGYLFQVLSGMVSKVMPALPVIFIAAPGAILLALVALVLLTPATVGIWADAVLDIMRQELP